MENPNVRCFVHSHHAGSLFEWHTENYYYENRLKDFDEIKSQVEPPWKIALRKKLFRDITDLLPLFRDITDLLPPEWDKARAELDKAGAEWDKARAEWAKAGAEWDKARAEWAKARAEWDKARAEWDKAGAEWDKAGAELDELVVEHGVGRLHDEVCNSVNPDCPWDGSSIFGKKD